MSPVSSTVAAADGRQLEVVVDGPDSGDVVLFHPGTPNGPLVPPHLMRAAADRGLRTVVCARPGYGASTPQPGRTVFDAVADTRTVLDALGVDGFWNAGWSGGGPHALAVASAFGDRCRATAVIAGVAPHPAEGLDWMAGMDEQNVEEFQLSLQGADALTTGLEAMASLLSALPAEQLKEAMGGLLSGVDKEVAVGEVADFLAESIQSALVGGIAGWRDDDLAFVSEWGFDVTTAPRVLLFQGTDDHMVPAAHATWLADHIPGARLSLVEGEGHLSLATRGAASVIDALLGAG
jgi:pimeloyl-ACP methyl ester carboxylesterase